MCFDFQSFLLFVTFSERSRTNWLKQLWFWLYDFSMKIVPLISHAESRSSNIQSYYIISESDDDDATKLNKKNEWMKAFFIVECTTLYSAFPRVLDVFAVAFNVKLNDRRRRLFFVHLHLHRRFSIGPKAVLLLLVYCALSELEIHSQSFSLLFPFFQVEENRKK